MRKCDSGFQLISGRASFPRTGIDRHARRLTRRPGFEGELRFPAFEDAIIDILFEGVRVGEPADTSAAGALKLRAIGINQAKVVFHLLQVGNSFWGERIIRLVIAYRFQVGPTVHGKDDLHSLRLGDNPVQIELDEAPGIISGGGLGAEIGQHGEIDKVDGIQNRLSAAVSPIAIGRFRDGDGNRKRGEVFLDELDLAGEVIHGQVVKCQGLGTDLNGPGDKLGLGVAMESREQGIPVGLPLAGGKGIDLARG